MLIKTCWQRVVIPNNEQGPKAEPPVSVFRLDSLTDGPVLPGLELGLSLSSSQ